MQILKRRSDAIYLTEMVAFIARRITGQLRRPDEAAGRAITTQLFLLASGAQVLRSLTPPLAQAWCRMMLDTRGDSPLPEPVLAQALLRATGGAG